MPWYQSKPHIWRNFLAKFEISLQTQENFSKYVVWIGTKAYIWRSYYLENFKKIVYQDLQTTYLEIFSCVCSDISNLAHRNSPKLAQINRIIDILLSGEFQENRISGSTDICLGTTPNHIFGDISLCL